MLLQNKVIEINPFLNPQSVQLGIGNYAGTEGSQANNNLSQISNILPFALPMATMGLMSQTPNIIDNSNSLLADRSAQDVIDNHINKAITWTPDGMDSRPDAPEEINLEEWKKRNILSTPIYEPNIDDYSTGGNQPEIEVFTGSTTPIPNIELPTHTGFPPVEVNIPDILYTLKTIYHGTDKDFDEFDVEQSSDGSIWFTDDKKAIENREVGASGFGRIIERQIDEGKLKLATSDQKDKYLDDELIQQGYDGVKFSIEEGYDNNSYRIFNPEKLLDVSYRLESPSEDNARLDDLTQTFPDDIYSSNAIRYYGNPNNLADIESNEIIQEARGNPDMEVTIYRAVPNNADITSINEGDFVTLSKTYAEEHGAGGYGAMGNEAGKILTKKVKVEDLVTGGNDLNEFGYFPLSQ